MVRTYHVSPRRRWLIWYVLGPIILGLLIAGLAEGGDEGRALLITAGLVFVIGLPFQLIVDRARLELSPAGVRLRQAGYELRATWDDIADIRLDWGREGFVTREPMTCKGAARLAAFRFVGIPAAPFYDEEQRQLLAQRRFIPFEAFAWHLRRGAMAAEIARFAPQLAPVLRALRS